MELVCGPELLRGFVVRGVRLNVESEMKRRCSSYVEIPIRREYRALGVIPLAVLIAFEKVS